jgi:uncharacterized membrane protein (DUF2068 family)
MPLEADAADFGVWLARLIRAAAVGAAGCSRWPRRLGVSTLPRMASEKRRGLVLIGVLKLLKSLALFVAGVGLLSLLHRDAAQVLRTGIDFLRLDAHAHLVEELIAKVAGISRHTMRNLGVGTLLYAVVFGIEGCGLLLGKAWAEYLTALVTVSFLPIEGYELVHHPSIVKGLVILINAAIVAYLVIEIRRRKHQKKHQKSEEAGATASIL